MRIKSVLLLAFAFIFSSLPNFASAQSVSECRIKASSVQFVSLGFPVNPDRLANILNPKILVIPYRLKDANNFTFGEREKSVFAKASDGIYKYSSGKSRVTFEFNEVIDINMTIKERDAIRAPQNNNKTWQERFDESTWGFMKNFITEHDSKINYSGYSGVILFSNSPVLVTENAEAMMLTKDIYGPWFNPISTAEGDINNVVVLYNHNSEYTITHEVMHLFGLTDLYGAATSPRDSLMSSYNGTGLLALEKWVLGWLGDENVQCLSETDLLNSQTANNTFTLEYSKSDQLLVIPTGEKTALVVDVFTNNEKTSLNYYALDTEARPSNKVFNKTTIDVTKNQGIGTFLQSPKLGMLISDNDGKVLTISLFPVKLFFSESGKQLQATAENNRAKYLKIELDKIAAASKKTTITCVKGKLTKKVTAVKPVCPKGYKKK
jgi:M6 family metalloprotease-like protein